MERLNASRRIVFNNSLNNEARSDSDEEEELNQDLLDLAMWDPETYKLRPQPKRLPLQAACGKLQEEHSRALLGRLAKAIATRIQGRLAESTMRRRKYLQATLHNFLGHMRLSLGDQAIVLALEWISDSVAVTTLLTYAQTFKAMYPQIAGEALTNYILALRKQAGSYDVRQAPPITAEHMRIILGMLPESVRWAAWLAWMTCSRWADVRLITSKNILCSPNQGEVVINFKNLTKASASRPFRNDHVVLVKSPRETITAFVSYVNKLNGRPLTTWTTTDLTQFLRRSLPGTNYSAHSIKRGAIALLMQAAAEGLLPLELVAQMAKHLGGIPALPDTTVRYVINLVNLARANRSGRATELLVIH